MALLLSKCALSEFPDSSAATLTESEGCELPVAVTEGTSPASVCTGSEVGTSALEDFSTLEYPEAIGPELSDSCSFETPITVAAVSVDSCGFDSPEAVALLYEGCAGFGPL